MAREVLRPAWRQRSGRVLRAPVRSLREAGQDRSDFARLVFTPELSYHCHCSLSSSNDNIAENKDVIGDTKSNSNFNGHDNFYFFHVSKSCIYKNTFGNILFVAIMIAITANKCDNTCLNSEQ